MQNQNNTNKRSFIITGGNSGLGYQCARNIALADENYHIILACRDAGKADQAITSLTQQTGNQNITFIELDLASLDSIRKFAAAFAGGDYPPLYGLVCNAGLIMVDGTHQTKDGFELTFGVNHLGHFLLVNLLLEQIADAGRIVFVSSGTHDPANKTIVAEPVYEKARLLAYPETPDQKESILTTGQRRYSTSKLCNIYCAYELAERLQEQLDKKITVNAFDPGEMPGTGFSRSFPAPMRVLTKYLNYISVLFKPSVNTSAASGKALAQLMTDPEYRNVTGKYFEGTRQKLSSDLSYSERNQKELWDASIDLTKLKQSETIICID